MFSSHRMRPPGGHFVSVFCQSCVRSNKASVGCKQRAKSYLDNFSCSTRVWVKKKIKTQKWAHGTFKLLVSGVCTLDFSLFSVLFTKFDIEFLAFLYFVICTRITTEVL